MANRILLAHGEMKALIEAMNSTYPTVRAALRYECNSDTAKKIRDVALRDFGGVETVNQKINTGKNLLDKS